MKTMRMEKVEKLIKEVGLGIGEIYIPKSSAPFVHDGLARVTVLSIEMAHDYIKNRGPDGMGVVAFTVDKELELTTLGRAPGYAELREMIQDNEEGTLAYVIMVLAPRVKKNDDYTGTDEDVEAILATCSTPEDVKRMTNEAHEGLTFGFSAVVTVGTHDTVWSTSIIDEDRVELVAFSDREGHAPIEVQMHSLGDGETTKPDFTKLFHNTKVIPLDEWVVHRYASGSAEKLNQEGDDFAGPEGVKLVERLVKRDGHDHWKLAYACLRKLCDVGGGAEVPMEHRSKLIALFQSRIDELKGDSAPPAKKPTHKAPEKVQ